MLPLNHAMVSNLPSTQKCHNFNYVRDEMLCPISFRQSEPCLQWWLGIVIYIAI